MPAKSRSQQRLFGMVHAYNKGELHGSRAMLKRIAEIAKHVSDDDAEHFAKTKHKGLPETKEAQVFISPDTANSIYSQFRDTTAAGGRSGRRRSVLGSAVRGAAAGALVGGVGFGTLGAILARKASKSSPELSTDDIKRSMRDAGIGCGLWGAGKGAIAGAITGIGLNVLDKVRGEP